MKWRKKPEIEEQIRRSNEVMKQMAEIVMQLQSNTDRLEMCLEALHQEDEDSCIEALTNDEENDR